LNEPETSIHIDLLKPMADLIIAASENSQILLTTHSKELARFLRLKNATVIELEKVDGATAVRGIRKARTIDQKKRVFLGDDSEVSDED